MRACVKWNGSAAEESLAERRDQPVPEGDDAGVSESLGPADQVISRRGSHSQIEGNAESTVCDFGGAQQGRRKRDPLPRLRRAECDTDVVEFEVAFSAHERVSRLMRPSAPGVGDLPHVNPHMASEILGLPERRAAVAQRRAADWEELKIDDRFLVEIPELIHRTPFQVPGAQLHQSPSDLD